MIGKSQRLKVSFEVDGDGNVVRAFSNVTQASDRSAKSLDKAGEAAETAAARHKRLTAAAENAGKILGTAIVGGATVAVTAMTLWTREVIRNATEVERLATLSNTGTTEFQRYAAGAAQVGVEQGKLGDIFKDTQDKVGDFLATGGGELKQFFEEVAPLVGVTAEQFRNLSGPQALELFYSTLERANLTQAEMVFYLESVADEATLLQPLLADNARGFREAGDQAERMGAVLDDEAIAATKAMRAELVELDQALAAMRNEVVLQSLPALQDFVGILNDPSTREGLAGLVSGIAAITAEMVAGLSVLGSYAAKLIELQGASGIRARGGNVGDATEAAASARLAQIKRELAEINAVQQGGAGATSDYLQGVLRNSVVDPGSVRIFDPSTYAPDARESALLQEQQNIQQDLRQRRLAARQAALVEESLERAMSIVAPPAATGGGDKPKDKDKAARTRDAKAAVDELSDAEKDLIAIEQVWAQASIDNHNAQVAKWQEEQQAAASRKEAFDAQAEDMQFELQLLGMSNRERETAIALRRAGVDVMSAEGQQLSALTDELIRAREQAAVVDNLKYGLADMFASVASGSQDAGDAFADFATRMKQQAAQFLADKAIEALFDMFGGDSSGGGNGGGFDWGQLIGAIGGAFGGSGGWGGVATGGLITGPGTGTSDSIPKWLSNGEFVVRASSVAKYGPEFMHALNAGRLAEGGMVGEAPMGYAAAGGLGMQGAAQPVTVIAVFGEDELNAAIDRRAKSPSGERIAVTHFQRNRKVMG